jgi:uncharacterized protein (DUF58 family)
MGGNGREPETSSGNTGRRRRATRLRSIDWRRSARSDGHFVRQTEWQAAQSVMIGVDDAASMTFTGAGTRPSKLRRAQTLAMAIAILAVHGGERVGLTHLSEPPRGGRAQLMRMAQALMDGHEAGDYGAPKPQAMPLGSRAVFFSDFLGDPSRSSRCWAAPPTGASRVHSCRSSIPTRRRFPMTGERCSSRCPGPCGSKH